MPQLRQGFRRTYQSGGGERKLISINVFWLLRLNQFDKINLFQVIIAFQFFTVIYRNIRKSTNCNEFYILVIR